MGLRLVSKGDWRKTKDWMKKMQSKDLYTHLQNQARTGVDALAAATPVDSGVTAASWSSEVVITKDYARISWTNNHIVAGTPLVIMLQFGHGTGTGGWVQGRDFINPAIQPTFDEISDTVWKAVTS